MKKTKGAKRGICAALSMAMLLCGISAFSVSAAEPVSLLGRTWASGKGTWEQKDGQLVLSESDEKKDSSVFLSDLSLKPETLTLEARVSGFQGQTADITNPAFLLVLGADKAAGTTAGQGVIDIRVQDGQVAVYEWDAERQKMAVAQGSVEGASWRPVTYGTDFTLKVEIEGSLVKVAIDGKAVDATWTLGRYGDEYEGGDFAVATWGAAGGLKVESLTAQAASLESEEPNEPANPENSTTGEQTPTTAAEVLKPVNLLKESWKSGSGVWTQKDGKLVLSESDKKNSGVFLTSPSVGDEDLVLEAKISGFKGESADITNPLVKLVLGVNSVSASDPAGKGIVDIRVQDGKVAVYEWNEEAGKPAVANGGGWKDAAYGEDFTLKVEMADDKVTVSVDGNAVGTWTIGRYGDEYKGGGFAVATWGAANGLTVERLEATAASLKGGAGGPATGEELPVVCILLALSAAAGVAFLSRKRVRN